jgi:hypothetical protein
MKLGLNACGYEVNAKILSQIMLERGKL